jgi:hypothetical protein
MLLIRTVITSNAYYESRGATGVIGRMTRESVVISAMKLPNNDRHESSANDPLTATGAVTFDEGLDDVAVFL